MECCKSELCQCPLSGAEVQRWLLFEGLFYIKCVLKSIGTSMLVRLRLSASWRGH